jgi:chemotaxis protein CheX
MTPESEDVQALMADTCEAVLGLAVHPAAGEAAPSSGQQYLRGRILVTGAWQGAISFTCTAAFARAAADRIFEGQCTSPEDVRDAIGELTNIIGGGIKGLMPAPSRLSLPSVSEAAGWHDGKAPTEPAREVWFACSGQHFVVTVTAGCELPPEGLGLPS